MQQIPKSATRRTARITATERFHATAGRSSSVKVLVGAIAAVFLVVVGIILLNPREDHAINEYHVEQALQAARGHEDAMKYDLAQAKYEEALRLMGGSDRWRTQAIEVRGWIKDLKARRADLAAAEAEWKAFRLRVDSCTDAQVPDLLSQARAMAGRHRGVPWAPQLAELVEKLQKMNDTNIAVVNRLDFMRRRKEIQEKCGLADRKRAHWSDAVRAWKQYLSEKIAESDRGKVENEMRSILQQAREELDAIGKRAARMVEEGKKAEALDYLKSQRGRFELTECAGTLEKLITSLDR